ncbi:MAG: NADH-quinone oxidoreductase subunit J [Desulforhabdus sp.]|jgi:NADH-quinone oxidoreductase subunit J|nr:NADH-quinone oxidoreductase subunit J [Desulforhabdus sp.]
MTFFTFIFFLLAIIIVVSTGLAITRRNLVHAIIYLVFSFLGSAMLFYLLGAPLLAAFEVIIYAGAIMVLFLFIVMSVKVDSSEEKMFPFSQLAPTALFGFIYIIIGVVVVVKAPGSYAILETAVATPKDLGHYTLASHWLSVEIVSLLLLIALIGVLCLGQNKKGKTEDKT